MKFRLSILRCKDTLWNAIHVIADNVVSSNTLHSHCKDTVFIPFCQFYSEKNEESGIDVNYWDETHADIHKYPAFVTLMHKSGIYSSDRYQCFLIKKRINYYSKLTFWCLRSIGSSTSYILRVVKLQKLATMLDGTI